MDAVSSRLRSCRSGGSGCSAGSAGSWGCEHDPPLGRPDDAFRRAALLAHELAEDFLHKQSMLSKAKSSTGSKKQLAFTGHSWSDADGLLKCTHPLLFGPCHLKFAAKNQLVALPGAVIKSAVLVIAVELMPSAVAVQQSVYAVSAGHLFCNFVNV